MKTPFPISIAMLLAFVGCQFSFGQDETISKEDLARIQLPMDRDESVFVYDVTGGFRMVNPDQFQSTPMLTITGDGKVVTGGSTPGVKRCEQILTESQLNQFLHFVVNQQQLYQISETEIKQEIVATGQNLMIADAGTSKFTVNLQRGRHTVNVYALIMMARRYKDIDGLQRLLAVEDKCKQLIAQTNLGAGDDVAEILDAINKQLKQVHPQLSPIDASDVRYATPYESGKFQATFEKPFPRVDNNPDKIASIRYIRNANEAQPDISIRVYNRPR